MGISVTAIWLSGLLLIATLLTVLRYLRRARAWQQAQGYAELLEKPYNTANAGGQRSDSMSPHPEFANPELSDPALAALGFAEGAAWPPVSAALAQQQANLAPMPTMERPEAIVVHVMARQGQRFFGYDLLQSLLLAGLHFDKKGIFQRYEQLEEGKQEVAFSLVSAVEPGIFDLNKMGAFSCPGVTLFMPAEKLERSGRYLTIMLEIAKQLAEDLDAEICGEDYRPLTEDLLEAYRDRIPS